MYKGLQQTNNARVLYVDMNAFFASVEQQRRPFLRNKPIAVVSHLSNNATVLAASYEAKAFGITTGTKIAMARSLCPSIIFTETTPQAYQEVHRDFIAILHDLTGPEIKVRSIDEAAIFLSPNWQDSLLAKELAFTIKKRFANELGFSIRCSIGIAPNLLLAKLASNLQKPDGLVEITLENFPSILETIQLTDLPGIAERTARNLRLHGITTPLELFNTPAHSLKKKFGIWGYYWWWRLHGFEPDSAPGKPIQSMSHEHVLTKHLSVLSSAQPVIDRMADRLIHRLLRNHFNCRRISLNLSLVGAPSLYVDRRFDTPTDGYLTLLHAIQELSSRFPERLDGKIGKITISFHGLQSSSKGMQLDLFDHAVRESGLSKAMELIRKRFGFEAVQLGNVITLDQKVAQEQLGFGRLKDSG